MSGLEIKEILPVIIILLFMIPQRAHLENNAPLKSHLQHKSKVRKILKNFELKTKTGRQGEGLCLCALYPDLCICY